MPLDQFISATLDALGTDAEEILVEPASLCERILDLGNMPW
jgi:hypothetical protein